MRKTYDANIFRRLTVNLTEADNNRLNEVLHELQEYYGDVSTPPSVSLILATVLKQFFDTKGHEGLDRLWSDLQEASQKKSER